MRAEYLSLLAAMLCVCGLAILWRMPCEHSTHALTSTEAQP